MLIKSNKEFAIVSTDIRELNNKEMRQMHELKNRINDVLISHKPEAKEKKYINDDDLKLMHAILSVFTKDFASTQGSAFDDFLKENAEKKSTPVEDNEVLIKGGPGAWPEEPVIGESKNF